MRKNSTFTKSSAGMSPDITKPKKTPPRKKPNPYKAPLHVKRYYKGIAYGMDVLRDDLIQLIDDENIQTLIKDRTRILKIASNATLTKLEKQKTKQKIKEWEEKEWEHV